VRYYATQDRRIKRMVELQALAGIGKSWRALDYPFATITPSYAAAIGASGDRPVALAQLVGTIANGARCCRCSNDSLCASGMERRLGTAATRWRA
jgi:hypothetical protein